MAMYGGLTSPALAMLTQSSAFGTISQNITNINTGGYKSSSTRFETILASSYDTNSDVGGVQSYRVNNIEQQGSILSTANPFDVAINGQGFFVLNSLQDGTGDTFYSRDGAFQLKTNGTASVTGAYREDGSIDITGNASTNLITFNHDLTYLADKNDNFLQGWVSDENGVVTTTNTPESIRVDRFAFLSDASPTSTAFLTGNIPATKAVSGTEAFKASVFDSAGTVRTFELILTKTATAQEWTAHINSSDSAITSATPSSAATETLNFGTSGELSSGTKITPSITYSDGTVVSFDIDLTNLTSIGSSYIYNGFDKDGRTPGDLQSYSFDGQGYVNGAFTNGVVRPLYKLPLATFVNPNGLENRQFNVFSETVKSGEASLREVTAATSFGAFIPFSHEKSNVNMGVEFNNMILAQQAYNTAATVFKTLDEMTSVAADLKS